MSISTPSTVDAATLGELLLEHARVRPEASALCVGGETFSFAHLAGEVRRYTDALLAAGVSTGDRIAVVARNGLPFVALHFASSLAGATLVGINWRLSPREVAAILEDCAPVLVLTEHEWTGLLSEAATVPDTVLLDGPDASLGAWLARGATATPAAPGSDADGVLLLLYTTGTTGRPKGVMLTERNVMAMLREVSARWHMRPDMRFLAVLPLFHVSGTGSIFSTLFAGGEVILPADASAEGIARTTEQRRVTHSALVPTILSALVQEPGLRDVDLSSLEVMIYGAAPSGGTLVQDAMRLMPSCGFTQGYGLTETCGGVAVAPLRRHGEIDDRHGTVGQACSHYEIRIVDPVTLADVPAGTDGEVWLRGPQNALGYWNRPEETAASFLPDGWFRTGDIGVLDADGYLYLRDRLKDLIITGGENVYSVEVESALLTHPDVLEVAVYGVPDAKWGETVKAVVVRRAGSKLDEAALIEHARTSLARYKCPRLVEFASELPKSGSGKIMKHQLRARDASAPSS